MARVIAFAARAPHIDRTETLRTAIVSGCALALILAKISLPFW